jgi:hypothetical protein
MPSTQEVPVAIHHSIPAVRLAELAGALGWSPDDVAGLLTDGGRGPLGFETAYDVGWAAVERVRALPPRERARLAEAARRAFFVHDEPLAPPGGAAAELEAPGYTAEQMRQAAIAFAITTADADPGLSEGALARRLAEEFFLDAELAHVAAAVATAGPSVGLP